jgi:hypothetical protein
MKPNVLLVSSTLPYLESPHEMIRFWKTFHFKYIIIDRTYFIDGEKDRLTVQTVPEAIYPAAYPAWFFAESRFLRNFGPEYELVADFDSYLNASQYLKDQPAREKRIYFSQKEARMKNLCTLFDSRYMPLGMALYESIVRNFSEFHLWVLALDDEAYRVLRGQAAASHDSYRTHGHRIFRRARSKVKPNLAGVLLDLKPCFANVYH